MQIKGKCHCGNIRFRLAWPDDGPEITIRACGCSFCTKHGGGWTSNADAELDAEIGDASLVSNYRFGTGTADFYVCSRCGVVPFVTSTVDGHLYAVVNVNTFQGIDPSSLTRTATSFEGEDTAGRLQRRQRNWIRAVRLSAARGGSG